MQGLFGPTPEEVRRKRMQELMVAPQMVQGNSRNAKLGRFLAALAASYAGSKTTPDEMKARQVQQMSAGMFAPEPTRSYRVTGTDPKTGKPVGEWYNVSPNRDIRDKAKIAAQGLFDIGEPDVGLNAINIGEKLHKEPEAQERKLFYHTVTNPETKDSYSIAGSGEYLSEPEYAARQVELQPQGISLTSKFMEQRKPGVGEGTANIYKVPLKETAEAKSLLQGRINDLTTQYELRKMLEDGVFTGMLANTKQGASKVLKMLGWSSEETNNTIANTDAYQSTAGKAVAQVIKDFGAGTGLSDADREYAAKIAAGDITMDDVAMKRVLYLYSKGIMNKSDWHNQNVDTEYGDLGLTSLRPWKVTVPKRIKKNFDKVFAKEILWEKQLNKDFEKTIQQDLAPVQTPESTQDMTTNELMKYSWE